MGPRARGLAFARLARDDDEILRIRLPGRVKLWERLEHIGRTHKGMGGCHAPSESAFGRRVDMEPAARARTSFFLVRSKKAWVLVYMGRVLLCGARSALQHAANAVSAPAQCWIRGTAVVRRRRRSGHVGEKTADRIFLKQSIGARPT